MDNDQEKFIERLIADPSFRDWVLARPGADAVRWDDWEKQHAGQAELINTAKAIVLALQLKEESVSSKVIKEEVYKLRGRLGDAASIPELRQDPGLPRTSTRKTRIAPALPAIKRPVYRRIWFRAAAASLFVALGLGWLLVESRKEIPSSPGLSLVKQLPASAKYENHSDTMVRIRLPDQSLVCLNGNSTVRYRYHDGKREVILSGEAFFEVSRQPASPFLVHAGGIITRVLGTSFRVRAQPGERQAVVSVKTGKVYVAKKDDTSAALILTPNQQVRYDEKRNSLEKGLVDAPEPIREVKEVKERFRFERTPLEKVFEELQKVYGIPIIYDKRIVASCSLSATMGEEPFFEKLKLICKVVNATYEIIDGSVVIYAKGCG